MIPFTPEEQRQPEAAEVQGRQGKTIEARNADVVQETSIAKTKPKRVAKPPNKFGDFVSN